MKRSYCSVLVLILSLIMAMSMSVSVFADEEAESFDDSTTLPDGEYVVASGDYSIVKPDGSDVKNPLTCKKIIVSEGKAKGVFETKSSSLTHVYNGVIEEESSSEGEIITLFDPENPDVEVPDVYKATDLPEGETGKSVVFPVDLNKDITIASRTKAGNNYRWVKYIYHITKDEYTITNRSDMINVIAANVESNEGQDTLVFVLSSTGYRDLFKGTFKEAVDNDDNEENWVHGVLNAAGKYEFRIPLTAEETSIPIVTISKRYYDKYKAGENALERAFYPRLLELDKANTALYTDDYQGSFDAAITNNISKFKPGTIAGMHVTGGPYSNSYAIKMKLTMESDSYDAVKADSYSNYAGTITIGEPVEISISEGNVFEGIPVLPGPQILKFRSKNNGNWYNRKITIDLDNKTAVFDPLSEEEEAAEAIKDAKKDAQTAVTEAEALDTSVYSKTNADAIATALQELKDLIGSDTATVDQIATAKTKLQEAIKKANGDKKAAEEKAAAIKKVQNAKVSGFKVKAGKKKATFTWKKNTTFAGYELKYKVGKKTKTIKIKSAKTVKKVIKKLKKGKKVSGKIRGYKKISGKTYYGKWAKSKTVKVK